MPEFVREKWAVPNKFGHPDANYWKTEQAYRFGLSALGGDKRAIYGYDERAMNGLLTTSCETSPINANTADENQVDF